MNKIIIKLIPTFIFIIIFIIIQFLPSSYGLIVFGILVIGYIYGIYVFLERYRENGELNQAISVNLFLLFIVVFGVMSIFVTRILLEVS